VFGPGGRLYASEHGPNSDDEVNLIESGKNYGWPYIAGYIDDKLYAYENWSRSAPETCNSLRFDPIVSPSSVPKQRETAWSPPNDFKTPIQTFFTVSNDYDLQTLGAATIAPGGLDIYTAKDGIPGWADSLLVLSLKKGLVYRVKLSSDGRSVEGEPREYFKSTNRYRDIALGPDRKTIYLSTDNAGNSTDASGRTVRTLENPGAILEFSYRSGRPN
jgi:PQQ-dependent dehydrogenase (s-GDH family)